MAFLENGSPVATKLGPIATINTSLNGKATATSIFSIANTTRVWLAMPQLTSGTYSCVTSTGTATLYVYDTSYDLIQEISVNTTSASSTISSNFSRIECVASTALDLSITPANAKITSAGGTIVLDTITGTGNYGVGSGTATGGTSGYTAGQKAHAIVVAGSGGGGGASAINSQYGPYGASGGAGGLGGVTATTSAFDLQGTYSFTVGAAGAAGNYNQNGAPGNAGGAGGATNGFSLQANGGNGGNGANSSNSNGSAGSAGSPTPPNNTDIYLQSSIGLIGNAQGNGGNAPFGGNVNSNNANAGNAGKIIILRWTP